MKQIANSSQRGAQFMVYLFRLAAIVFGPLAATGALAVDVNVVGLFPNKAVVQIDGGAPQVLSVGQKTRDDVFLVAVDRDRATLDIQGRRETLALGSARKQMTLASSDSVTVAADRLGHFVTDGQVNGAPVRFFVDTGATFVTLPAREATRLGLDYRNGQKAVLEAATGDIVVHRVKLDTVRVGEITLYNVDAVVTENDNMSDALLGMSFLKRMNLSQEGAIMKLTKRN